MSKQAAGGERPTHRESTASRSPESDQSSFGPESDQSSFGISGGVRKAAEQATNVAADAAETIKGDLKNFCNHQLRSGAKMGNQFASSLRVSANALPSDASMLASAMRSVANQVDAYAAELSHRNIDQVAAETSAFLRRRPGLIFGLTALAGFAAFRMFKSAQSISTPSTRPMESPSIQPAQSPSGQPTQSPIQPTRIPSDQVHG